MGFEFEQGLDNVVSIKVIGVGGGGGVGAALTCRVKTASAPLLTAWIR